MIKNNPNYCKIKINNKIMKMLRKWNNKMKFRKIDKTMIRIIRIIRIVKLFIYISFNIETVKKQDSMQFN